MTIVKLLNDLWEIVMQLIKLFFISACMMFATIAVANDAAPLNVTTEYYFVGHLGTFDADGRLLAWEGPTSGDIEGIIRWWMVVPFQVKGQVTLFANARWEIWDETDTFLILEGYEAGTTTNRPGKTGVWRANGIVTYVNSDYLDVENWFGRRIHDGGEFIWAIPGELPDWGWGKFRVN
jgi:hypothetical protein